MLSQTLVVFGFKLNLQHSLPEVLPCVMPVMNLHTPFHSDFNDLTGFTSAAFSA